MQAGILKMAVPASSSLGSCCVGCIRGFRNLILRSNNMKHTNKPAEIPTAILVEPVQKNDYELYTVT